MTSLSAHWTFLPSSLSFSAEATLKSTKLLVNRGHWWHESEIILWTKCGKLKVDKVGKVDKVNKVGKVGNILLITFLSLLLISIAICSSRSYLGRRQVGFAAEI